MKADGLKVISNAGGINPMACVAALRAAAKQAGVELSIAAVTGDDLLEQVRGGVLSTQGGSDGGHYRETRWKQWE